MRLCKETKTQEGINRQNNQELTEKSWAQSGNVQMTKEGCRQDQEVKTKGTWVFRQNMMKDVLSRWSNILSGGRGT